MLYFAYGSNLSIARLRARVPSADPLGCHVLEGHDLRFHKVGRDGSAKGDAYFSATSTDVIYGVLFEICASEKPALDLAEGLGNGYEIKTISVTALNGFTRSAFTYQATHIDCKLKPYSWYMNHVLIGARESHLPEDYIQRKILSIESIEDNDKMRCALESAIHR